MIIQSGYGVQAYNSSSRVALQQQGSGVTKFLPTNTPKDTEQVSLSSAGKALSARETRTSVLNSYNWLSDAAHANSSTAEKLAHDWSYASDDIAYDAYSLIHNNEYRLASTMELVTAQDKTYFDGLSSSVRQLRIGLYESEKAKGTPAADIVDMMIAQGDSLPEKYKQMIGWGGRQV